MSIEVRVPALPESVADATLLCWHHKPGDAVKRDDNLLDLETDKVVLEVPAPADGILTEQCFSEGDVVNTDQVLARIDPQAKASTTPSTAKIATDANKDDDPVLTPAVRRLVKELGLNPSRITGTGKEGRILKADVMKYLDNLEIIAQKDPEASAAAGANLPDLPGERPEQRVPMTRLRARIAERLLEAQSNAAILTTFNEVDLLQVTELRSRYRDSFEQTHEVKLGFMSFFVRAVVEALKKYPVVNASIDGENVIYHGYYDIGIAVSSPRGLVVPILRDADQMTLAEIEKAVKHFGRQAREGTLSYEDLTGGTFSISNGGVFGSMLSTPILNPPQSAILGMHNIQQRPVVVDGEICIRPMMYLALSYDHRLIDGREAVSFLVNVKQNLEDPARLLLQL